MLLLIYPIKIYTSLNAWNNLFIEYVCSFYAFCDFSVFTVTALMVSCYDSLCSGSLNKVFQGETFGHLRRWKHDIES